MLEELLFRIIFIVIYAFFGGIRIYYRIKNPPTPSTEATQRKGIEQIGGWIGILLSVGILGVLISLILYLVIPPWISWFPLPFPSIVRWVGVVLGITTIPFLLWIHRSLGRYYSAILEIRKEHTLIKIGQYSRIRHPMYTIFILFILSSLLLTANLLVTLFGIIVILLFYPLTKREEQMMINQFGDEYREYMKHTGRFLPRLYRKKLDTDLAV